MGHLHTKDARSKRQIFFMFDNYFDRLVVQIEQIYYFGKNIGKRDWHKFGASYGHLL